MDQRMYILGAGMTGLGAGLATGLEIFEAAPHAGGICASYYVQPGAASRMHSKPPNDDAFRFEIGGGHWIFGGDRNIIEFLSHLVPVKRYSRRSSVYLQDRELFVPYPIQNHLGYLDERTSEQALKEILAPGKDSPEMKGWLSQQFGKTLCEIFFYPFHDLYTAGLYERIAPQDDFKSPLSVPLVVAGMHDAKPGAGYNATFLYPEGGLDQLVRAMAERCKIRYGKRVTAIDLKAKELILNETESVPYDHVISTVPLSRMADMAGLELECEPDPYTSVLVLNIGAKRGPRCPEDHWIYCTDTRAGFHRVGFYSNVDPSFLPAASREARDRVSIYVEKAYTGPTALSPQELETYTSLVVKELQMWSFIGEVEALDPTWIDVAYTWSWPGSRWRETAMSELERHGIHQTGRYGAWRFQGIADSIRDGLLAAPLAQLWRSKSPAAVR